jgi:hypothetical protein
MMRPPLIALLRRFGRHLQRRTRCVRRSNEGAKTPTEFSVTTGQEPWSRLAPRFVDGMLYVNSGGQGLPGNVLLAFSIGK